MIYVSSQGIDQLFEYCKAQLPYEACGVILGTVVEARHIKVHKLQWIRNTSATPRNQFILNPAELVELLYPKLEQPQLQWIGVFHSHPATAAIPSQEDLQLPWNLPTHWIISMKQPNLPVLKAYEFTPKTDKKPCTYKEQALTVS